jgi:transcriptional regulator with XRE-family HTH domain
MTPLIKEVGTVEAVSDKSRRYDEDCANHARKVIRQFVDKLGTEQAAADELGVHQSTINNNLNITKQPTLRVLIPLSRILGRTIDEILGLGSPPVVDENAIAELVAKKLEERFASKQSTVPPRSTKRQTNPPRK